MEQRSFSHIPTYVFKAESALDSIGSSGHSSSLGHGSSAGGSGGSSGAKKVDLHQSVEAKLALCTALSHLANGNYAKAMHDFLQPMSAAALAPWNGTIVSVGDIAVYATLCALATLGRSELKARVIESEGLAGEGEGMKELLDAWMASNFRTVLGLLEKYSVSSQRSIFEFTPASNQSSSDFPGLLSPRSPARSTRRESHGAHSLPRGRALFPAVRDDPA
jgi:COP9 signalosome complex subunit 1